MATAELGPWVCSEDGEGGWEYVPKTMRRVCVSVEPRGFWAVQRYIEPLSSAGTLSRISSFPSRSVLPSSRRPPTRVQVKRGSGNTSFYQHPAPRWDGEEGKKKKRSERRGKKGDREKAGVRNWVVQRKSVSLSQEIKSKGYMNNTSSNFFP